MAFPILSLRINSLLLVVALAQLPSAAHATAVDTSADEAAARGDAKRLFDEGTDLYDHGAYDAAIGKFREAYRLWPDPLVIFAVAQAQRLMGSCAAAIESYERFVKAAQPSPVREEAAQRLSELRLTCVAAEAPKATTASAPEPKPVGAAVAPQASTATSSVEARATEPARLRVPLAIAVGGVLLGGLGTGTYLWNTSRLDRWRAEDAWLGSAAATSAPATETQRRQDANDTLSKSIQHADQAAWGLLIAGTAAVATAAVLYFVETRR